MSASSPLVKRIGPRLFRFKSPSTRNVLRRHFPITEWYFTNKCEKEPGSKRFGVNNSCQVNTTRENDKNMQVIHFSFLTNNSCYLNYPTFKNDEHRSFEVVLSPNFAFQAKTAEQRKTTLNNFYLRKKPVSLFCLNIVFCSDFYDTAKRKTKIVQ